MAAVGVILLAFGLFALFALAGWGLLELLAPNLPADVTGALAPVAGVAAFSAVAAFVVLRLPVAAALLIATGLPLSCVVATARRSWSRWRHERVGTWLALASVVLVAILGASVPSFVHDGGMPSTWGNADPYLWVSQAKSMLSGPPPAPATRFPDRVAYEHLSSGGWAPGLPALTALAAVVAHEDPVDIFGAVAALLYALTPLVAFAIARVALAWSFRLSVAAAAVVALSPYRLFSSYYGWQPQIAGVACLLAAALLFRVALAGGAARRRLILLAAIMLAGALGIYRLPFLPYLVFVTGLVVTGHVVVRRRQAWIAVRALVWPTTGLAATAAVLAAPSVAAFTAHAWTFWRGEDNSAAWSDYVRGLPSDALGLVPRAPNLTHQPPGALQFVALALSLVLLASGLVALRRAAGAHRDLVIALCVGSLAAVLVAQLPLFTPYFSIKLNGYGAVPMILTALAPLNGRNLPPRKLAFGGLLALVSLAVVASAGRVTLSAAASASLSAEAAVLPSSEAVRIGFRSSWKQMWAVYFTRDHAASIAHPSDYLTHLGLRRRPCAYVVRAESVTCGAQRSPTN